MSKGRALYTGMDPGFRFIVTGGILTRSSFCKVFLKTPPQFDENNFLKVSLFFYGGGSS